MNLWPRALPSTTFSPTLTPSQVLKHLIINVNMSRSQNVASLTGLTYFPHARAADLSTHLYLWSDLTVLYSACIWVACAISALQTASDRPWKEQGALAFVGGEERADAPGGFGDATSLGVATDRGFPLLMSSYQQFWRAPSYGQCLLRLRHGPPMRANKLEIARRTSFILL